MTDSSQRLGVLATEPEAARAFFDRVFDPAKGELRLQRTGRFWEAVATARRLDATGAGRCVAVIDAGFDVTVPALAHNVHPDSVVRADTVEPAEWHGTVVALLVRTVAPDAQLLLIDVYSPGSLQPRDVGEAVDRARRSGADVINLSLEFTTDAELRDTSWIDADILTSAAPPVEQYLAQVDAWIKHAEPYASQRCRSRCEICTALGRVPDSTLVVAASGNRTRLACPACVARVVGAGFHRRRRLERDGVVFTTSDLPETKAKTERSELVVDEPPGFLGTSFASPLLSGFAALLEAPSELTTAARAVQGMTPVLLLAGSQAATPPAELPEGAPLTLHQGLVRFTEGAMPARHRHFDEKWIRSPCPLCALLFVDWYDIFVSILVASGKPVDALAIARIAAVVTPETPSVNANYGLAARSAAQIEAGVDERRALLTESFAAYERACTGAPDVAIYRDAKAAVDAQLSVLG